MHFRLIFNSIFRLLSRPLASALAYDGLWLREEEIEASR